MLTYNELSPGQRKWVLMVQTFHPEIKDTIEFEQIHEFHREFVKLRETDSKYKTGLPNWLIRENRIKRGVYFFPSDGAVYIPTNSPEEDDNELELKYQQYLADYKVKRDLTY